ncbi:MAG: CoA pyrophosphatase [Shewanella sp.]|nr:CoA pyrophosphatase [Shewanella sp.]MCF1430232.1 CoA pyrophosphatase [Shewanella sp.]MCF1439074.1 CoA pyrophosphatase [Shewanella sp.]MCF1458845.1 CoA pyrophosphatase [Shewanella sp.]
MNAQEFRTRFMLQRPARHQGLAGAEHERQAAVLIPLWQPARAQSQANTGELELILIQRARHLKAHPGQISFPGGKRDHQDDSLIATALREATEEIALPARQVEVLGKLPVHHTITGFAITPVIALVTGPFNPVIDTREVAECFTVPWRFLLSPSNRHLKTFKRKGHSMELCFIPWQDKFIWGATAAMIVQLCRQMAVD